MGGHATACPYPVYLNNIDSNGVADVTMRVWQNSESYNFVGTCHGMSNMQVHEHQLTCHGMSLHHTGKTSTIDRFCDTFRNAQVDYKSVGGCTWVHPYNFWGDF